MQTYISIVHGSLTPAAQAFVTVLMAQASEATEAGSV